MFKPHHAVDPMTTAPLPAPHPPGSLLSFAQPAATCLALSACFVAKILPQSGFPRRRFVKQERLCAIMDVENVRKWFVEHKLRAVGTLWATSLLGSFAYNFSQPNMKTSVKLIHARLHAQALTLAALAGSAVVEYYDHQSGEKSKRYEKHFETAK